MVIVNIKKEDSKKAFKKEAVFKVPKIKGYPTIRIEKGCDFQRNTNFSYSSQPHFCLILLLIVMSPCGHGIEDWFVSGLKSTHYLKGKYVQ